jgi:hypothetical protein
MHDSFCSGSVKFLTSSFQNSDYFNGTLKLGFWWFAFSLINSEDIRKNSED